MDEYHKSIAQYKKDQAKRRKKRMIIEGLILFMVLIVLPLVATVAVVKAYSGEDSQKTTCSCACAGCQLKGKK